MLPHRRLNSASITVATLLIAPSPLVTQEARLTANDTCAVDRRAVHTALLLTGVYLAGGFVVMDHVWYRDQERVPFHFFNDNAAYLQVDKFGHAFGSYVQSHVGYHYLRGTGMSRSRSLLYGGAAGLVLQTPIEIMDALHEGWGFSWGDMAANAIGSGLVVGQEVLFGEQVARYRFSYWESSYARMANGYLGASTLERLLEDYNGHTYWLSVPLVKLTGAERMPRWLSIAIGYGANGMFGEFENIREYEGVSIPETTRYRQYLLSLDVDWTMIQTGSPLLKMLFSGLTFVKVPLATMEVTSEGRVRGYWLYY